MIEKIPAIYKLKNKRTGEIYIGGTRNAQGRKRQHEYDLRSGRHRNPNLQQAYINGDRFDFVILEYLSPELSDDSIVRREQEWKEFLKPSLNSRNAIAIFGSDLELSKQRKLAGKRTTQQTEDEKKRRGESVKRYWATHERRKLTEEEKRKISERVRGENHPAFGKKLPDERRARISDGVSKYIYTFISPDGKEIQTKSVKRFAKENGLSENWMYDLVNGHRKTNSGWSLKEKIFIGQKRDRKP